MSSFVVVNVDNSTFKVVSIGHVFIFEKVVVVVRGDEATKLGVLEVI